MRGDVDSSRGSHDPYVVGLGLSYTAQPFLLRKQYQVVILQLANSVIQPCLGTAF
jgi:hypothetical protein